ncbi:MAG: hypothetical protein FWF76_01890 [Oscillospiraceae bacterium]|nr:hypothetical protein [Oscillospiraceae bacterium]
MNDIFIEQLITRKPDNRATTIKIGILVLTALLCTIIVLAIMFIPNTLAIGLMAIIGAIWLSGSIVKGLHTEYEYILTNQEFDIDKISGKRKRRRMITLDLTNTEKFDRYNESTSLLDSDVTVSAHDNSLVNLWYLTVKHNSHGRVALLFNPSENFLEMLNKALPPKFRLK